MGAMVLGASIRKTGSKHHRVCLYTDDVPQAKRVGLVGPSNTCLGTLFSICVCVFVSVFLFFRD